MKIINERSHPTTYEKEKKQLVKISVYSLTREILCELVFQMKTSPLLEQFVFLILSFIKLYYLSELHLYRF